MDKKSPRRPVAFLTDDDAWLTMHRTFKLSDYMSDDYSYREGRTWVMARPDSRRMPRGVCLQRREAAHPDIQAFCESLEKGNRKNAN